MIQRSVLARWGLAAVSIALAIGIRASLNQILQTRFIFILAFCAVIATSWFGGRGPGLLAVALGCLGSWYFLLPPSLNWTGKPDTSLFQAFIFTFISTLIAILTGSLRSSNDALRDSEAYLRFVAAAMPEILFTTNAEGQIETLSERFFEFSGKQRSELSPLGWLDLVHADEREATLQSWNTSLAKQSEFRSTCRLPRKDGAYHWFQCRAVPMLDKRNRVVRWVGVCADIDDHKRLEEVLAQQSAALARSNEDLQRFAFAASHDLQEPLKMIAVFSELLIRKQGQSDESSYVVAQITRGVQRMQELIQSTLEFSRIRGEDVETLSAIGLDQPLSEALWSLQSSIDEAEARILRESLPWVQGDSHMLSRVFQNLIQNAIKFRSKAPLVIKISAQSDTHTCVVSVADNGIGLSVECAEAVFEPFRRLHPKRGYPGPGLGLASVKRIVELHRGHVWVESEPEKGASFFFYVASGGKR